MAKFTTKLRRLQLDASLSKYRGLNRPQKGYIREIRNVLEMSSYSLAERMGLSQSTVMDLEESEQNGTITLNSLSRAAASLGCKLVYALVPETSLDDLVLQQARHRAEALSKTVFRTMALEKQASSGLDNSQLIELLAEEIMRKGKREIWKNDTK